MAVSKKFVCDGCGAEKKEANNWISATDLATANGDSINERSLGLHKWPWMSDAAGVKHFCGAECVIKHVQAFLGKPHE